MMGKVPKARCSLHKFFLGRNETIGRKSSVGSLDSGGHRAGSVSDLFIEFEARNNDCCGYAIVDTLTKQFGASFL